MVERRRYPGYDLVTRVDVRLPHRDSSVLVCRGNTEDVSPEGLTVALHGGEVMTKLIQSLLSERQSVRVASELPSKGKRIRAEGIVMWLQIGPVVESRHYLRVGIFLKHMSNKDRAKWGHFVQNRAQLLRQESPTV